MKAINGSEYAAYEDDIHDVDGKEVAGDKRDDHNDDRQQLFLRNNTLCHRIDNVDHNSPHDTNDDVPIQAKFLDRKSVV